MEILKLMLFFFRNRQTKRNLVKRQWIDVTFYDMRIKRTQANIFNSNVKQKVLDDKKR